MKGEQTLRDGKFNKIAIANPTTAPTAPPPSRSMKALGVHDDLTAKFVQGNNINQTFQFVDTGNAELGFIALSQVIERPGGSRWIVAAKPYTPIRQDAVLLKTGARQRRGARVHRFPARPGGRRRHRQVRLRHRVADDSAAACSPRTSSGRRSG